jgi:predicted oxidoreductase
MWDIYIYGIYLKQHIFANKLDIRCHIYMVTHIWDIYGIYPKQHMFAKKLKIEQKLNEKK